MIVIEMTGGLGNQMFQFCLYERLRRIGKDVYLDASAYDDKAYARKLEIFRFSGIKSDYLRFYNDSLRNMKGTKEAAFLLKRRILKSFGTIYHDKIAVYQPEIFDKDWVRLIGYWQNECFFKDIRVDIIRMFSFAIDGKHNQVYALANDMARENSVSLHVRRGDYLDPRYQHVYCNICSLHYYGESIRYICDRITNPVFYVFSDDMEWVKENISVLFKCNGESCRVVYVDCNKGDDSYLDMYLMSQCKHHIIANSTFSWWGAWLGTYKGKVVVSPARWFANHEVTDTICDDWIRVDC